jgi:phage repressor protein C with HTH and peptisase S24 domain
MEVLVRISDVFHISLDILLREELSKMPESKLREITFSAEDYPSGKFLRVLTTMVDSNERELIEMVSEKAKAGYTSGYADPEFIGELPRFQLPMLPGNRKYRGFQLSGDSMLPMASGSWVIAEYVDDWQRLKDGSRCVVLTRNDGIVFKIVYRHSDMTYLLVSQNPSYQPYELNVQEIVEIWRFKMVLTDRFE